MPRINYPNRANLDLVRLFRFLAEKDVPSSGYLALYDFDERIDAVTVHAVRHQKENDYQ